MSITLKIIRLIDNSIIFSKGVDEIARLNRVLKPDKQEKIRRKQTNRRNKSKKT